MHKPKLAFSLIELSIVILVIGILVLGITKGSRIIRASKLKTAASLTISSPVNSIDGILLWMEPTLDKSFITSEVIDTPIGNTGTISRWNDINPHITTPNNAIQSTNDDKPRYLANAINSLPALNFDGTDFLSYDGTKLVNNNYTIFVVEQRRSSGSNMYFLGAATGGVNGILHLGYRGNTTLTFDQNVNGFDMAISGYSGPTPRIHSARFNSNIGKNYYINGTFSGSLLNANGKTGLVSYGSAQIGKFTPYLYVGDIGEVIMFGKYLTDTERTSVETYLKAKWGIK